MEIVDSVFKRTPFAEIEGDSFTGCIFEACDFSSQDLSNIRFLDCMFNECNWTMPKLVHTRLQNVIFRECKLMGVDFTSCDSNFLHLSFEKCLVRGCNFIDLPLKGSVFKECQIKECQFIQANLEKADFSQSILEGSIFHNTNLKYANFEEAVQFQIDPLNNVLKGAKFSKFEALSLLKGLGIEIK